MIEKSPRKKKKLFGQKKDLSHVYPPPLELLFNWDGLLKLMEGQVKVPWDLVGMSSPGAVASV